MEKYVPQNAPFMPIPIGRRAGHYDALGIDHLAHHAARAVRRCHEHRIYSGLLRGDLLQTAEQNI